MQDAYLLVLVLLILMIPVAYMLGRQRESLHSKVLPWYGPAKSAIPSIVDTNTIYR